MKIIPLDLKLSEEIKLHLKNITENNTHIYVLMAIPKKYFDSGSGLFIDK